MMMRMFEKCLPIVTFCIAFWLIPLSIYHVLDLMPGDIGDARLNNYFLENIFQFLIGNVPSIWHPGFFYPFPWVIGLSDNLFGASPLYIGARASGLASDTAFQIWFLLGYLANFASAYYAMRRLGGSIMAASLGALIFTFALPTSAHAGHAQLHFRFGVPLTLVFFGEFLDQRSWRALLFAFGWLVWQFFTGVYMGFFTLVFVALMVPVHLLSTLRTSSTGVFRALFAALRNDWATQPRRVRIGLALSFTLLFLMLVILFFPYLKAKELYSISRSWGEIRPMLPTPQSYLLSDGSKIWSFPANPLFEILPMRHEHQMFMGFFPLLLATSGLIVALRSGVSHVIKLLVGSMGLIMLITVNVGGISLWFFFHWLPLASAIRAVTRFDQVLLFPVGVLAMVALDALSKRLRIQGISVVFALIALACIAEMALYDGVSSSKALWRQRIATAEAALPTTLPSGAVLFMSQRAGPFYADELDAMWVALRHGIPTINGYSGSNPPGADTRFGNDCTELSRRIFSYQKVVPTEQEDEVFKEWVNRVVLVGFTGCDLNILRQRPTITVSQAPYSSEEVQHLSYKIVKLDAEAGELTIAIENTSGFALAAHSGVDRPLRLSWRYLNSLGMPLSGWDNRKDLPEDIPAEGKLSITLPLEIPESAASVEVSMVQEMVFWLHDVGVTPVSAPLPFISSAQD